MAGSKKHSRFFRSAFNAIEALEARRLLSTTVPNLSTTLEFKAPAIILPGTTQKATLKITNTGGNLIETSLPISVYISDAPTLNADSNQQTILTLDRPLRLAAGKYKNMAVHFTMPASFVTGTCYILVSANQQVFSTSSMYNPSAGYGQGTFGNAPATGNDASEYLDTGTWTANGQTNAFSVNIRNLSDGSVYGDVLASGNFGQLSVSNLITKINKNGRFNIHGADITASIYPPGSSGGGTTGGTDSGSSASGSTEAVTVSISGQINAGNMTGSIHMTSVKPVSTTGTTGSTTGNQAASQTTGSTSNYTKISGKGTFVVVGDSQAPVVAAGSDQTGQTLNRIGLFTAENSGESWTATVNYGDGSGAQALALNTDKSFTLSHNYAADGAYTVEVDVTDMDGNVGKGSFVFTSENTAPTVTINQTQTIYTNSAAMITGAYTGAGVSAVIVTLSDGTDHSKNVLATINSANETWNANISIIGLPDGDYNITSVAVDPAGDSPQATTPAQLVVDTIAPDMTIDQTQTIYTNSGTAITGTYSDANININGIVVTIDDGSGDTQNFPATVNTTNNTWSAAVSTTALPAGTYNITATATDLASNVSAPATTAAQFVITHSIDLDQLPATVGADFTLTGDYPNPLYVGTITVTLTNSQGNSLAPFTVYTANTAAATWSAPISTAGVPDGIYTVTATDTDTGLITTMPGGGSLTISTIGSNVQFDSSQLPLVTNTNQVLTGTYNNIDADGGQITNITVYLINPSGAQTSFPATVNSANNTWTAPINIAGLANGAYTIIAAATDSNGNTGTAAAPGNFTVDNLVNTIGSDVAFAANSNAEQSITLGTDGDFTLTFDNQTTADIAVSGTQSDMATSIAAALQALSNIGTGNISVLAQSSTRFLVTFTGTMAGHAEPTISSSDSTATVTTVQTGANQWPVITSNNITLNGTYTNPDSQNGPDGNGDGITAIIINLVDSQGNVKSFVATLNDGNWSAPINVSGLADGTYTANAVVFDSNGNTGTAIAPGTFTKTDIRFTAGQLPIVAGTDQTLTGSYAATDIYGSQITSIFITLTDSQGNQTPFIATLDSTDGTWSAAINVSSLADGTYTVSATFVDSQGNIRTAIAPGTFTVNTGPI